MKNVGNIISVHGGTGVHEDVFPDVASSFTSRGTKFVVYFLVLVH